MAKRYFSFKNGINITPVSNLPTTAKVGDVIYLITENVFKYYDGTDWQNFSSSIIKVTAGENLTQYYPVYISKGNSNGDVGRNAGQSYILNPFNNHRISYIGIAINTAQANNQALVQINGKVNIPASLIQGGSFVNGEIVYWDGTQYTTNIPAFTNFWRIKVGRAVSNTEMLINPDLGVSAIYIPDPANTLTINNNITTFTAIGLSFDPMEISAFKIYYHVIRVAGSTEVVESGILSGHYNANLGQWILINYGIASDAGVEFGMIGNNLAYISSNLTGAPYSGVFRYSIETEIRPNYDFVEPIHNNVNVFTPINGMFLSPSHQSMQLFYFVKRTVLGNELSESGIINVVRNDTNNVSDISVSGIAGDAEITFDVTPGGQVRYKSSNMVGSNYSGQIYWKIIKEL